MKMEDTKKNLHEAIADWRKDLHKELNVRMQGTQVEIEMAQRKFQMQLKEVEARAACTWQARILPLEPELTTDLAGEQK
jgi:hypothetical protein